MFLRRLVAGLMITAILSGCATTLPQKSEVEYVLDENGKPEIIQPDDNNLSQAVFEVKINEIKAKANRYILSDTIKTEIIGKVNRLLTEQKEHYLKNVNKPRKAGILSIFITTVALAGVAAATKMKTDVKDNIYYNDSKYVFIGDDIIDGGKVATVVLVCAFSYATAYLVSKEIAKKYSEPLMKPGHVTELHRLIAVYNGTIKGQLE